MSSDPILAAASGLDDDFNYFSGGPPSEAEVAALEAELGHTLPAAHRALIGACQCLAVVVKDEVWPPPKAYEIRPAWQMWRGLEIFGLAPAGHPLSLLTHREDLAEDLPGSLPLAKVIGAGHYLVVDDDGAVSWWTGPGTGEPVEAFDTAVLKFLAQLAQDKERVKREGIKRS
jgi:hypothetical protein